MDFAKQWVIDLLDQIVKTIDYFEEIITSIMGINIADAGIITTGIESAALALAGLFLAMEMISLISDFRFERIEDAIRLWIKVLFAKIIIENSSSIIGGIYDLFRNLGSNSISEGFNAVKGSVYSLADPDGLIESYKGLLGIGYVLSWIVLLIVNIIVVVMLIMITIEIFGITFEIGIHQAIGPIAISTLCNSTARSTGIAFIKSYAAVCLQTTVIGVIFKVYAAFSSHLKSNSQFITDTVSSGGPFGLLISMLSPMMALAVLCVTVKKSSDLTKRMFGA